MPRAGPQASSSGSARRRPALNGPHSREAPSDETEVVPVRLIPSKMTGDLPSFNDWASHVVEGNHLYMFGGCRPSDSDPTSDFYRWDTQSMRWSNLTNATRFLSNPTNPFGDQPVTMPLPRLHQPALAPYYIGHKKFMLLFGGRNKKALTSDLVAVNLDDLTWFVVQIEGDSVIPRRSSSMVTVDNRVFIFGGSGCRGRGESKNLNTYCVAEYTDHDMKWRWVVRDEPFPEHVPSLGQGSSATSVYGGKKILLTPGRDGDDDAISLSGDNCILFHTTNYTFQTQSHTAGDFPEDMAWYTIGLLPPVRPGGGSPGRARKATAKAASQRSVASSSSSGQGGSNAFATPSVFISGWIRYSGSYLVPELWKYSLPPDELCECLNIREKLWALDLDMQSFVVVGGRSFLLGRGSDNDLVWNTCVEIFR